MIPAVIASENGSRPRTAELGMPNEPTGSVAGQVKLRDDANATVTCVGNDLSHLILCVEMAIGAKLVKARELLAFDAETLVFSQVPVKDVEFYCRHRIEIALQHIHRLKMASNIDQQATPWEAWAILNLNRGDEIAITITIQ